MRLLFLFVLAFLVFPAALGIVAEHPSARIINGDKVPQGKYKFMVSLQKHNNHTHFCGGSVLNDDTILTAGHCVLLKTLKSPADVTIELGSVHLGSGTLTLKAARLEYHPRYKKDDSQRGKYGYDIALVKLAEKIDFDKYKDTIEKVCLAGPNAEPVREKCIAMGWGIGPKGEDKAYLHETNLPIVDPNSDKCQRGMGSGHNQKTLLCTWIKNHSACSGDSGSPLICPEKSSGKWLQFGIASYVTRFGCFQDRYGTTTFYSRVAVGVDWIQELAED